MRVVLAPDKFKGTLTAARVRSHLRAGLVGAVGPAGGLEVVEVVEVPVADGGDGTVDAVVDAGYELVPVTASGPTGDPVATGYARSGATAVVELATVSGLGQLPGGVLAPLAASSAGTGELVAAALDAGCTSVLIAVGGSACTDGGAGMVRALGAVLTGPGGAELPQGGAALADAVALDLSGLDPRLAGCEVVVACDVDNPLLGPHGAAAVYGPQKGAGPDDVAALEAGLRRWDELVSAATGRGGRVDGTDGGAVALTPGAGAAGGVAYGAMALLGAHLRPGIDLVLDLVGFTDALVGADLVVTGEGRLDAQTLSGKAPAGVAAAARAAGVPVVVVSGSCELDAAQVRRAGFAGAWSLVGLAGSPEQAMSDPGPLLERAGALVAAEHLRPARAALTSRG